MAPPRRPDDDAALARKRAAYFRGYYERHKAEILEKNRKWGAEHKDRLKALRQARRAQTAPPEPAACVDCARPVPHGPRCRNCHARHRYATDPDYRARRLASTRRWLERRAGG
jgi:hypothetical protein